MLWRLPSRLRPSAEQGRLEAVEDAVVDAGSDTLGAQAAEGVRDDEAVELGQSALFGFELEQVGEGGGADRDGWDSNVFEED